MIAPAVVFASTSSGRMVKSRRLERERVLEGEAREVCVCGWLEFAGESVVRMDI